LLAELIEVFQDIILPWHKELKEKRELLREDPFVGFIALAAAGAAFYFFTRQSPSWIGSFLHYAGIAMFILGSFAALAAGWFGWGLYRKAAWPTALLALLIYGGFDTYEVVTQSEKQPIKKYNRADGAVTIIIQTDEIKRFTGRPLHRSILSTDIVAERPQLRGREEGPLNSAGQRHGRWEIISEIPKQITPTVKWYWEGQEMTQEQWEKKKEG
jgi:hypothetical protein